MKLAILGGSFNPIHMGHLLLADAVLSSLKYDRIILVPAFSSPFKPGAEGASAADRLDMLAASIPGDPRLTIDDGEIRREGVSYTIDTLVDIDSRYRPEGKLGLILGDDLVRDFPRWRRVEEIVSRTDILIAHRISSRDFSFPYPYKELKNDIWDLSSGLVRDRIRRHETWQYMVPPGARLIIEERGLYGHGATLIPNAALSPDEANLATALSPEASSFGESSPVISALSPISPKIVRIEDAVRAMVSPSRFLHSRNTALLAYDLCLRVGLESPAGYLAGISHDMCKSFTDEELTRFARMDGEPVSKLERKKPSLLHARAAAVLLRERFGIHNRDILEAVRLHTSGSAEMGPLAKVVYIADKIEVSRERVSVELRDMARTVSPAGLDTLFAAVLDETVAYLRSRKLDISEGTLRLLEAIHKRRAL